MSKTEQERIRTLENEIHQQNCIINLAEERNQKITSFLENLRSQISDLLYQMEQGTL